jgi:enoyl-CoA hydratase/carnithine racemase
VSRYESIRLTRSDGITEVRFHTGDGPLVWNAVAHREAGAAFAEVAGDPDTKVVIVTGTGDAFCTEVDRSSFAGRTRWDPIWWEGKRLLKCLLDIDVPVLGAINGPALVHAEIPLLADVVVAADTTVLADKAHFSTGSVPGDGVHLVWPYLLGPRRAKYFLITNQELGAAEALQLGVVSEVVPAAQLMDRVWTLARDLAAKPLPFLRYTREALNIVERERLLAGLSHGLALEGVAFADTAALRDEGDSQRP